MRPQSCEELFNIVLALDHSSSVGPRTSRAGSDRFPGLTAGGAEGAGAE
jgi:hypothetical protein